MSAKTESYDNIPIGLETPEYQNIKISMSAAPYVVVDRGNVDG